MNTLMYGSNGQEVKDLQRALIRNGAQLVADGIFGESTETAVRAYQLRNKLVADGIAGQKTLDALVGRADPRRLQQADIVAAAKRLGVAVAVVMAVNEVESRGNGFLGDGRAVILFERHVFYRQLEAAGINVEKLAAQYPQTINTEPGGYAGGSAEYTRLSLAKMVNNDAALESCSWGLFQIMGYHWKSLGFASVTDFVEKMQASEKNQLDAFCKFVEADAAMLKALKGKQWASFARLYNGPAYERNLYDIKLARAFERHQTALGASEPEQPAPAPEPEAA